MADRTPAKPCRHCGAECFVVDCGLEDEHGACEGQVSAYEADGGWTHACEKHERLVQ